MDSNTSFVDSSENSENSSIVSCTENTEIPHGNKPSRIFGENFRIIFVVLMAILLVLLFLILLLQVFLICREGVKNEKSLDHPYSRERLVGMMYNGTFFGKISTSQDENVLNYNNEVEGLIFYPFGSGGGEQNEEEVLYQCEVKYQCKTEETETSQRRINWLLTIGFGVCIVAVLSFYHDQVEELALLVFDKTLSKVGKGEVCESVDAECSEFQLPPEFQEERPWFCSATCSEVGKETEELECWEIGEERVGQVDKFSTEYFGKRCKLKYLTDHECNKIEIDHPENYERCSIYRK